MEVQGHSLVYLQNAGTVRIGLECCPLVLIFENLLITQILLMLWNTNLHCVLSSHFEFYLFYHDQKVTTQRTSQSIEAETKKQTAGEVGQLLK